MSFRRRPPKDNVMRVVPHGTSIRGVLTNKCGRTVQYGSFGERRLIYLLEQDKSVADYSSRPEVIEYKGQSGAMQTYVPHFIVWRRDGTLEWHHVGSHSVLGQNDKQTGRASQPKLHDGYAAATEICTERGWQFVLHSNDDLPKDALLSNLQSLECFEPTGYRHPDVALHILFHLGSGEKMYFQTLIQQIADASGQLRPTVAETVYHMLWHGQLEADMEKLLFRDGDITPRTPIWLHTSVSTQSEVA